MAHLIMPGSMTAIAPSAPAPVAAPEAFADQQTSSNELWDVLDEAVCHCEQVGLLGAAHAEKVWVGIVSGLSYTHACTQPQA